MERLLILTNSITQYRIPVFNRLSELYDLTVAYYNGCSNKGSKFQTLRLHSKSICGFTIIVENLDKISCDFNHVIVTGELRNISFMRLGFYKRNYTLIYWGGDVSFSYTKHYDEDRKFDKIRFYLMNRADSILFYTSYPIHRYVEDGKIDRNKLFVANNTVYISERINISKEKKYFLFVGTLYKEKGVFDLLLAYQKAIILNKNLPKLFIIGDGEGREDIEEWIDNNYLSDNIQLKGAIYDSDILKEYFRYAIACVSPRQAGLSVLTSLGYGVPFVTSKNAITGGEIFNLIDGYNGYLYDSSIEQLKDILIKLYEDKGSLYKLCCNAQDFYYKNATLDIMVSGFVDSINFAKKCLNAKVASNQH